jgi:hypothetical protein
MFKYIWIIFLAVPYLIWTIFSIYDFYNCLNRRGFDGVYDVSEASWGWLITLGIVLFSISFVEWCMQIANM